MAVGFDDVVGASVAASQGYSPDRAYGPAAGAAATAAAAAAPMRCAVGNHYPAGIS